MENPTNPQPPNQPPAVQPQPPPPALSSQPSPPDQKMWIWLAAGLVLVLVLLLIIILAMNRASRPTSEATPTFKPDHPPQATTTPTDKPAASIPAEATVESLETELDALNLDNLDNELESLEQDASLIP